MKKLIFVLLILELLACAHANAESLLSSNSLAFHAMEHIVASSVLFTGGYLVTHDLLKYPKLDSFIFSAAATFIIGFGYKLIEGLHQGYLPTNTGLSMTFNVVGVLLPAVVMVHFDL